MPITKIHLRKLLMLFYAPNNLRVTVLRADIRQELKKERGNSEGGGDFYTPFWSDAKAHVTGTADLQVLSRDRIDKNRRRRDLYPRLTDGFLNYWNEKRRWRNEPFELIPSSPKARFRIPELDAVVKVENLLTIRIGGQEDRIIYPYFSKDPELPSEGARIGLWLLDQALKGYRLEDMRILDILRSASCGTIDYPLHGDEGDLFLQKYDHVLREWKKLKEDYE